MGLPHFSHQSTLFGVCFAGGSIDTIFEEAAKRASCRPRRSTISIAQIMAQHSITPEEVEAIRRFDTSTIPNAAETLNVRPRNEGYIQGPMQCLFPKLPPVAGFAATGRMRSSSPPMQGRCYYDHVVWWQYVASVRRTLRRAARQDFAGVEVRGVHYQWRCSRRAWNPGAWIPGICQPSLADSESGPEICCTAIFTACNAYRSKPS